PRMADLPPIRVVHPDGKAEVAAAAAAGANGHKNGEGHGLEAAANGFKPYLRNDKGARPWAIPGTAGLEHRIGGLEKADVTGNVDYSPVNHHKMVMNRVNKVAGIANHIPLQDVEGPPSGTVLVLSWGGTFGAVRSAVNKALEQGKSVAHAHLRYMNPFPKNLGVILKSYDKVLIPELNTGQLRLLIRGNFLVDAIGFNKIQGKPFLVHEIEQQIDNLLK
ncbi:MAG TPA: 2-oxoglutarate ferredoxin oxidoreductase subunit alpha, partial [Gemmataceae bacterium]|nr:2-oxoglutarate ferredoxin oxidoreductase subunit alpha [Gemmataceae bacterium]